MYVCMYACDIYIYIYIKYVYRYVCMYMVYKYKYIYTNVFYMQTSAFTSVRKQENRETNN